MNCVAENILRAYQDGELSATERQEIEIHVANCGSCAKRLQEIAAMATVVGERLSSLDAGAAETSVDANVALARFKARSDAKVADVTRPAAVSRMFDRRWRPAWVTAVAATIILGALAFPSGRSMAQRFLATLRVEKVQPVALDFSAFDGNRPLGEMLSKMLSDKVVVTANEKLQQVDSAKDASELAGFPVQLIHARTDAPKFTVQGHHAFHVTVDRERLQDVVDQAGRPDLLVPATIDGATVSVSVPRAITLEYGDCARHQGKEGEVPARTQQGRHDWGQSGAEPNTCLALIEAPVPQVNVPADLNIQQLAEIGFQLTRMSPTQARELAQAIDWRSTLVLPIPRTAGTYSPVRVAGVQGTLINAAGNRDPHYVLIWVKNGIIYGLVGHGDASEAVELANTLS
ncbi:MAG: zf-HC2 domain-containing protein [Acidobacteriota bacterium]|nr:zf-HC2 domain-containing protein [Acidobacteriota bacterium]